MYSKIQKFKNSKINRKFCLFVQVFSVFIFLLSCQNNGLFETKKPYLIEKVTINQKNQVAQLLNENSDLKIYFSVDKIQKVSFFNKENTVFVILSNENEFSLNLKEDSFGKITALFIGKTVLKGNFLKTYIYDLNFSLITGFNESFVNGKFLKRTIMQESELISASKKLNAVFNEGANEDEEEGPGPKKKLTGYAAFNKCLGDFHSPYQDNLANWYFDAAANGATLGLYSGLAVLICVGVGLGS